MDYNMDAVKVKIEVCLEKAINIKPLLTELDAHSGDGDLGISMSKGAYAIREELNAFTGSDIGELFIKCGLSLNRAAPSTMGTLMSGALIMVGKKFKGRQFLNEQDIVTIPEIMVDAIMLRGNAKLGDKTILDALIPLSEKIKLVYLNTGDLKLSVREALEAAKKGAKSTKGLIAKVGRAKWIADRSREYPDSGAVMCSQLFDALVNFEKPEGYRLPKYE